MHVLYFTSFQYKFENVQLCDSAHGEAEENYSFQLTTQYNLHEDENEDLISFAVKGIMHIEVVLSMTAL